MAGAVCVFGRRSPDLVAHHLRWELGSGHYEDWRSRCTEPDARIRAALRAEERQPRVQD